jgi:penicillin amidase
MSCANRCFHVRKRCWLCLGLLFHLLCLSKTGSSQEVSATSNESFTVEGLHQDVEVVRDRWGIHHIYAQNEEDLFFTQGFLAARDRLFQFELWRRRATGTVAEILGSRELDRDIGARLLRPRVDLNSELQNYHDRGRTIIEAFVKGINKQIELSAGKPESLPIEFKMLGIIPQPWTPDVVISRHQSLTSNVVNEVLYTRILKALGDKKNALPDLLWLQGGQPSLQLDPAIDLAAFPKDVLKRYHAYRDPIQFQPSDVAAEYRVPDTNAIKQGNSGLEGLANHPRWLDLEIGSNNWIVTGQRTLSTLPILANDPHRVISLPSLRYWVHLHAPGWNVIGAGEPTLPGVSIGHNEHGAWGLTIFGTDNEDLYIYETNPENTDEYRYQGHWEGMTKATEVIRVKGQADETVELKFTRHGPVLFEDILNRKAYALRAAWLQPGCAPYLASLRLNQAKSLQEFRDACAYHRMPALNLVWADRSGDIGWQVSAIAPLRSWSGLLPVPGDGRYEWDGLLPIRDLPNESNPARNYLLTANHYLFPNDYPHPTTRHYLWAEPYRSARIQEVLDTGRRFSVADMIALQNDELSIPARTLLPLVRDLQFSQQHLEQARKLLVDWDHVLHRDSPAAAIYQLFIRRLKTSMHALVVPKEVQELFPENLLSTKRMIDWLHSPGGRFGNRPVEDRDQLIKQALKSGIEDGIALLGSDLSQWKWGDAKLHHLRLRHPLSNCVQTTLQAQLDIPIIARGGDSLTITATAGKDQQETGGTFKMVVDTENWDNSVGLNFPGQSGNPADSHYRDLVDLWSAGKYFPVSYSKEKVDSVAESRTILQASKSP